MAKQTINQGTAPTGAGGDTFRTGSAKLQANDDEIYNYLGDGTNLNKLGTAAFKNTGTQAGNVMEVGAFGWGSNNGEVINAASDTSLLNSLKGVTQVFRNTGESSGYFSQWTTGLYLQCFDSIFAIGSSINSNRIAVLKGVESNTQYGFLYSSFNTTVDANGFLKSASPIVKLFTDKIEFNDEAQQQDIVFEKIGVGDYLIKGSSGFAQEGWYVETPKDANGNLLVAVVYEQLENGDISVKTYDYMLNNKGRIVADTETPLDIPENRWIDLRLQELPQPEIQIPESIAPPDFQPTNLAQAVAEALNNGTE